MRYQSEIKHGILILAIGLCAGVIGSVVSGQYLIRYSVSLQQNEQTSNELSLTKPKALPGSVEEALQNVRRSMIPATATFYSQQHLRGVGAVITSDGWVVTTADVLPEDSPLYSVRVGEATYQIGARYNDSLTSMVMVHLQEASGLPVVPFGDSRAMEAGDTAYVVSSPSSIIPLAVINPHESLMTPLLHPAEMFTTNVALSQQVATPSSLVANRSGELIALTTLNTEGAALGVGAIPLQQMLSAMKILMRSGDLTRATLGASITQGESRGVQVGTVKEGFSAATAGLQKGDLITRFGDVSLDQQTTLAEAIANYQAGDKVLVTLTRAGSEVQLEVELGRN